MVAAVIMRIVKKLIPKIIQYSFFFPNTLIRLKTNAKITNNIDGIIAISPIIRII